MNQLDQGAAHGRIALKAGRLLDVAAGACVANATVVVCDGTIKQVGGDIPEDCEVVHLGNRTLLPGLIDAHTHIFLHSNRMFDVTPQDNITYMLLQEYPSHRVARSVRALKIALEHGFTTIRDLGTEGAGYDDVGLRDAVDEGVIPGPRMQVAGPALSPTGTYPILHYRPDWRFPSGVGTCDGPDECRKAVREQASYGTNWLKIYATAGYGTSMTDDGYIDSGLNWTELEFGAIVDEARARGLRVAAHATTLSCTQMAIDFGVDSIEHAHTIRPAMAEQIAAKGISIVPTLTTSIHTARGIAGPCTPLWRRIPEVQRRSLLNCVEAGVNIVMGTDAGSGSIPWTHVNQAVELQNQVAVGLTPIQSIRSATTVAAALLGLQDQVGEIRPGLRADLVAVAGNPLADVSVLEHIDFVMKDGQIVRNVRPDQ